MEQPKNNKTTSIVYIALAVLLLLCLAPMPYGYYQLVRFIAAFAFGIFAWVCYTQKQTSGLIIFGGLTLLFQPFFKIALGRVTWNIVDAIVAGMLIWMWYKDKKWLNKS
jgi:hypothetical protein